VITALDLTGEAWGIRILTANSKTAWNLITRNSTSRNCAYNPYFDAGIICLQFRSDIDVRRASALDTVKKYGYTFKNSMKPKLSSVFLSRVCVPELGIRVLNFSTVGSQL
jgi:hypothetical protein